MISHKLKEVIEIADTVTVLRDGQTICTLDKSEVSEFVLIKNMVGREINNIYPERQHHLFKSAAAAVDAAKAAGVKVLSYDRLITTTKAIDYFVTFDSRAVGTLQAQYLVDHAEGRNNPLYLYAGALTGPNSFIFFQGAWDVLQPKIADGTFVIKNVLSRVSKVFEDERIDSCYGDLDYVDPTNTDKVVRRWRSGPYDARRFYWGWMAPHPAFFVRRKIYEKHGLYDLTFGTAADYELMLRLLVKYRITSVYIPATLVKMRTGGMSNISMRNRLRANRMDRRAWRENGLKPFLSPTYSSRSPRSANIS